MSDQFRNSSSPDAMPFDGKIPIYMQISKILTKKNLLTANEEVAENQNLRWCHIKRCLRKKWKLVSTCLKSWKGAVFDKVFLGMCSIWWREEEGKYCARIPFHTRHVTYLNRIGQTNAIIESVPGTSQPQRNITCVPRLDIYYIMSP